MKRWTMLAMLAFALCAAMVAAGCGGDDDDGGGTDTAAQNGDASPATGDKVDLEARTLGFVSALGASPTSKGIEEAFVDAADQLGWKVDVIDAQGDPQKMTQGVQSFVDQKVDGIATIAVDPSFAKPALEAAKEADIPTIQIGGTLENPEAYSASYEANDWAMGSMMARFMATQLGYEGDIGVMDDEILFVFRARIAGRDAVLASFPKLKVVANPTTDLADAIGSTQAACTRMVQANPSIKSIWLMHDAQMAPCLEGLRTQDKDNDVAVVGWFLTPQSMQALRDAAPGSGLVQAWLNEGSWQAIDVLAQHFATGDPINPQALSQQPRMQLFTTENLPEGDEVPPPPVPYEDAFIEKWESEYNLSQ